MPEIKSEIYKGLIYAGDTDLSSTIGFELAEPNQFIVTAGTLTLQGQVYEVERTAFTFTQDDSYQISLGFIDSIQTLAAYSPINPPSNWRYVQQLAGFGAGIEVRDGAIVSDVYVLKVLFGFPPEP